MFGYLYYSFDVYVNNKKNNYALEFKQFFHDIKLNIIYLTKMQSGYISAFHQYQSKLNIVNYIKQISK